MDLALLKQKRSTAINAATALRDKVKAENREMTDEEFNTFDAHMTEADDAKTQIKNHEGRGARLAQLDAHRTDLTAPAGRRTAAAPMVLDDDTQRPVVSEITERSLADPAKGFKSPREFMGAMVSSYSRRKITDSRLKPLASIDNQGLIFYERNASGVLQPKAAVGTDEQAVFSDPNGGFLVPEQFTPTLLRIEPEDDPMGGRTMRMPMQSPTVRMPARVDKDHSTSVAGGLTVSRKPESVAGATSQMKFQQVVLEASSLFGGAYVTEELLQDSPLSFAAILSAGFSDQFTYFLVNERLNGTGVGEFMGIMNSPCLITIAKENAQAAKTIVYQNVLKMRAQCWRYERAVWIVNHDCIPALAQMNLAVGTGGIPLFIQSAKEDVPDTLMGRPIIYSEYTQTLGTLGDIVLGVWDQFLEGIYQPLQSAESIHVRFLNNERTFKFWLRNAGAPWWLSSLKTKNSSNNLSPFLTLAAR